MAITPENSYFHQQWNLRAIRASEAWQVLRDLAQSRGVNLGDPTDLTFGSADIIITVLDTGVETSGGQAVHAAFKGNVTSGLPKGLAFYDFSRTGIDPADNARKYIFNNNDVIQGAHGSECAGIAVAGARLLPPSYASDSAIVGVAPNCRLVGLIRGAGILSAFYWAANLKLDTPMAQLDKRVPADASHRLAVGTRTDVISVSLGITAFGNLGFDCAAFGRDGKGVIICLASGNEKSRIEDSITDRVLVVGATKISDDGLLTGETRAAYSNYGRRLDLCAPAGGGQEENGANQLRTDTAVPRDCGTFDSVVSPDEWTVTISRNTDTEYTVAGPLPGIFAGQYVAIGNPALATYEIRRITAVDPTTKKISIEKKFNNRMGTLNLASTAARIPYQFAVTSAAASGNTLSFADLRGFAADQDIYIFDALHGERARIKKLVSTTQVRLDANLGQSYVAGARVVQGGHTVDIVGDGSSSGQTTLYGVASTDGFFVGQMVRITSISGDYSTPPIQVAAVDDKHSTIEVFLTVIADPTSSIVSNLQMQTLGGGEYTSEFNGTSAATPAVAGTAALVLSANPDLNWVEVRHILRETAHKLDLTSGQWTDESGQPLFVGFSFLPTFVQDSPATTLTAATAAGATTIAVSDPSNLANEVVVRLSDAGNSDFGVVLSTSGNIATLDRPLAYAYGIGATVEVGRKAHFSENYGRGRIDAMRAVTMAADWNVNDRDLWIRDFIGDTGAPHATLAGIDSPDVWVRTIGPAVDGAAALPMGDAAGPHQTPKSGLDAWIYVRVRNRGTLPSLSGMELIVTFMDTADPTVPIQFQFPDRWQMRDRKGAPFTETISILTPIEGQLQLSPDGISVVPWSDQSIPFQANPSLGAQAYTKPHVLPSIPAGQDYTSIVPWRAADVPLRVAGRAFLKVHITPFDGDSTVSGNQVHTNNNLTFKEIFFTGIGLLDGSGADLAPTVEVSTSGTLALAPFTLEVRHIPATAVNNIAITAIMTMADATTEQKVFAWDGSAWSFGGGAPAWLILHQPSFSGASTPEQALSRFTGSLVVDHTHASLSLHVAVTDNTAPVIARTFTIAIKAVPPRNAQGIGGIDSVVFRTFTDWDLLPPQSGANNYGPLPAPDQYTRYRTAAMFSGIEAGGAQLKAFAVTSGHGFIQEITGSNTQVNLVLLPEEQMNTPRGPVKYFVYRGLQKASFLDPGTGAVKGDLPAGNNELLNRYWVVRNSLNDEEQLLDPAFVRLDLERDDLGLTTPPNLPLPDDMPIAEVFDRYNRFPLITRGMWIGDFEFTSSYGFEIIVDGPGAEPTLADVRTLDHTIDVIYLAGQPQFGNGAEDDIATKLQRERILSYIDPAAFVGLIVGGKVERSSGGAFTTLDSIHDIYVKVLQKLATKDTVYLDIRNELNQSLNFYGNYGDGTALNAAQLQLQDATGTMTTRSYHHYGWPILALRAGVDFPAASSADKLPIRLALPAGDNHDPLLYLAGAALHPNFPDHALKYALLTAIPGPGALLSTFDLGVYNDKIASVVMPAALKVALCRRYSGATSPVFPARRILKDDLIDTLLSPDAPSLVLPPQGTTTWNTLSELYYTGWTSHSGFDFTVRSGRALDDLGEVAFAYVKGPAEINGGTSELAAHASLDKDKGKDKTARSFYEHLQRAGLATVTMLTTNGWPAVPALRVQSVHDNFSINVFEKSADDLISIAYTTAEGVTIRSAAVAANFLKGASQYFTPMNHQMAEDGDHYPYFVMDLGLEGVVEGGSGNTFEVHQVNTGVKLYSFDGRNYFSAAYTNAVAPLLPFTG
jgi:hypothetical protein